MDATILYTSGTTGHPKGAVSTHRAVLSALMSFACRAMINVGHGRRRAAGQPTPGRRSSWWCRSSTSRAACRCMLSCFAAGYKLVMMHKWDPARALELIERERVTQFVGVPTQSLGPARVPGVRAPRHVEPALGRRRRRAGAAGAGAAGRRSFRTARPGIGYGMTETNAYGPQNSGDDYLRKPTQLRPRGAHASRCASPTPRAACSAPNEVGEIWFRGPNLIRGYWNRPEATAETIVDGWLRTGDIGRIDEEGFVYVQDRAKDMVLRAGENVYCAEVEAALYEHPEVYEAAVFGVPHERLGEEVAARRGAEAGQDARARCAARLPGRAPGALQDPHPHHVPPRQLPRNPAGKILKRSCATS